MTKYTTYKPSGTEWIGEIPDHWIVKKMKYFVKICNGSDYKDFVLEEGGYPVYGTGGIFSRCSKFLYDKVSVLLGRKGSVDKPQIVYEPFWTSDTTYYTEIKEDVSPKYFFHLVKQIQFDRFIYGSAIPSMTKSVYDDMLFPYPPIQEQHRIVQFLDEKTEIIDKLISTKERKIELLKEQRTSLINQVITKGLDLNVKMKDSGVECIGNLPDHWEKRRVSNFGIFFKGSGIKKDEVKEEGFPCIRYGEIYTKYNRVVYEPISFIDEETSKNSVLIKKGDVLFTGSGETMEDIGKTIVYYGEKDVFVGGDIIVLRLNDGINPLYMSYLMNTNFVQYQKSLSGKGEIIVHIYPKNIKEIITPLPPQKEQQQIVEFLDKQTKEIDDLISLEQKKIVVLKEYRQSLISEVITGKIDVRTNVN